MKEQDEKRKINGLIEKDWFKKIEGKRLHQKDWMKDIEWGDDKLEWKWVWSVLLPPS